MATTSRILPGHEKRSPAIANEYGWQRTAVLHYLKSQGYDKPEQITAKDYNRLCRALENIELRRKYHIAAGLS